MCFLTEFWSVVPPPSVVIPPLISEVIVQPINFDNYPHQLTVTMTQRTASYCLQLDYYAVHTNHPQTLNPDAVLQLNDGAIAVYAGTPKSVMGSDRIGPVYKLQPDGPLAIPTGQIWIRFKAGNTAEQHRRDIEQAGYAIAEIPVYAPQAAWVRSTSGAIADALAHFSQLELLADIEIVEPQLLSKATHRAPF